MATVTTNKIKAIKWQSLISRTWVAYMFLYWFLLGNIALTYVVIHILGRL